MKDDEENEVFIYDNQPDICTRREMNEKVIALILDKDKRKWF